MHASRKKQAIVSKEIYVNFIWFVYCGLIVTVVVVVVVVVVASVVVLFRCC